VVADESLRQMLVTVDYQEVITYSFVDHGVGDGARCRCVRWRLANPIASQLSAMRTTLWGGLIETLRHNLNRQQARVRIFELGRVYRSQTEQPMKLGGLAYGDVLPEQWGVPARRVDFFDLKGDLERLFGEHSMPGR
jgi:phenylalanyl-tRNA synthetase beta chain